MIKNKFYRTFYIFVLIVNFALLFLIIPIFYSKSKELAEHRYDCCDQENEEYKKKAKEALENSNTSLTNGLETVLKNFQTRIKNRILWPANDVIIEIKKQIGLFELTTKNNDYSLKIAHLREKSADFEILIDKLRHSNCTTKIIEHENALNIQSRIVEMEKMVKIVNKNTNEITTKIDNMEDNLEKKAAEHLWMVDLAKEHLEKNIGVIQTRIIDSLMLLQNSRANYPTKNDEFFGSRNWFYLVSVFLIIMFTLPICSNFSRHVYKDNPHGCFKGTWLVGVYLMTLLLIIFFLVRMYMWGIGEKSEKVCIKCFDEVLVSRFEIQYISAYAWKTHRTIFNSCASDNETFFAQITKEIFTYSAKIIKIDKFKRHLILPIYAEKLKATRLQQEFSDEMAKIKNLVAILNELLGSLCLIDNQYDDIHNYKKDYKQFVEDSRNYKESVEKFDNNIRRYEWIAEVYFNHFFDETKLVIESSTNEIYKHINLADFSCNTVRRPTSTCTDAQQHIHHSFFHDCLLGIFAISSIFQCLPSPWVRFDPVDESGETSSDESSSSISRSCSGLDIESVCRLEQPVKRGPNDLWMQEVMKNDPDCSISRDSSGYDVEV